MRSGRLVSIAVIAIGLTACSSTPPKSAADQEADRIAESVGEKLSSNHARNLVDRAAGLGSTNLVVLRADGNDAQGEIDIRVHVHRDGVGFTEPPVDIDRCYRFTYANANLFPTPKRLDPCPAQQSLPPTTVPPKMPDGILDSLQATLTQLAASGTSDPDSVRAAVEPLTVGSTATVGVAVVNGVTGVGVGIPGECVMGRIIDGVAEAWFVPRVLAQPGETGCNPEAAARGEAKTAPH
ncbi:MAG: hypothetical protein QOI95_3803 [Acidimicrobiaceae bacterium]|jgi:hypothetical protein